MLLFCPTCSNLLTITHDPTRIEGKNRFECRTCPYIYNISDMLADTGSNMIYEAREFKPKKASDIVSAGEGAGAGAEKIETNCPNPNCKGKEAMFSQAQIRSADEPMTSFFTCLTCERQWREG